MFGLAFLLALGVRALVGPVQDENSPMLQTLGLIGSLVAGTFLILIGLTNLFAVVGIAKVFRQMRNGELDEAELERQLNSRGFLARLLGRVMRRVSKPWHLYPVGLLMGLGFDTATQVALLVLAAGTAAFTLPWYAILVLPVLFAAGMSLFDTRRRRLHVAGLRMGVPQADPQGLLQPDRHRALGVRRADHRRHRADRPAGRPTRHPVRAAGRIGSLNLESVGFMIVGMFVVIWLVALAVWRFGTDRRALEELG